MVGPLEVIMKIYLIVNSCQLLGICQSRHHYITILVNTNVSMLNYKNLNGNINNYSVLVVCHLNPVR